MPLQGTGPRLYRLQALLRQYLNTEADNMDTNATTHTGVGDDDFTSPDLADEDIQVFRDDREGQCATVVIVPTGARRERGLSKQGAGTNQARFDQEHDFQLFFRVKSDTATWGEHGAWLRADRLCHAAQGVLLKYPTLTVPDASPALTTAQALWCEPGDVVRLPTEEQDDTLAVTLLLTVSVRTMERVT